MNFDSVLINSDNAVYEGSFEGAEQVCVCGGGGGDVYKYDVNIPH